MNPSGRQMSTFRPYETEFLRRYDQLCGPMEAMIDIFERTIDLLFRFLGQNNEQLSNRAHKRSFSAHTGKAIKHIEPIFEETLSGLEEAALQRSSYVHPFLERVRIEKGNASCFRFAISAEVDAPISRLVFRYRHSNIVSNYQVGGRWNGKECSFGFPHS